MTTTTFAVHTLETVPEASRPLLQKLQGSVGMVPNLAASMAESPQLLEGFLALREILLRGSFSGGEAQVLALTNAYENGCRYCMALHSAMALKEGVPRDSVDALRGGRAPADPRLGALSNFSRSLVARRGHVTEEELGQFFAAGLSRAEALEVVLGVAVSILPNFAHQITRCPIDPVFDAHRWDGPRG
jgi:AhpD family alkylhydroperoxidase